MKSARDPRCPWHRHGKPPNAPTKFFQAGCDKCEQKLADGLVSASDPTPDAWNATNRRAYTRAQFRLAQAERKAQAVVVPFRNFR